MNGVLAMSNQLTKVLQRRTIEYCPLCGSALLNHSIEITDDPEPRHSTMSVCTKCKIAFCIDIYGDIDIDNGSIYDVELATMALGEASETIMETCVLKHELNQEESVDYLRDHRTPRYNKD